MGQTEPMNQEMEFDIGEEEKETTVEMNEDGSEAKLADEKEAPVVEEVAEEKPVAKKESKKPAKKAKK